MFYVDDYLFIQEKCENIPFGGNLSVRRPSDKIKTMIIGLDEVIMKQYIFSLLAWSSPNGSSWTLMPKDEGLGLIISGFASHELGFQYSISPDVLCEVNRKNERTIGIVAKLLLNFCLVMVTNPHWPPLHFCTNLKLKQFFTCY